MDYVYDFTQSEDHSKIYNSTRYGASDNAKGCLEELSINDDGSTEIHHLICDNNPDMTARKRWILGSPSQGAGFTI